LCPARRRHEGFSTSFSVPSTGLPLFSAAKSMPLMVSANGFSVRAGSLAAITVPSLFRSSPLLAGVGWIPRTLATTLSIATSPATTAFSAVVFHRHGKGHHQFPGACINVRRGHDRPSVLTTC
jgi:hypothetical protein